jgi:hypothetical protein
MFFLPPAQTSHQRSPGQTGDPGGHRELEKTLGDAGSQVGVVVEGWGLHLLLLQEDHLHSFIVAKIFLNFLKKGIGFIQYFEDENNKSNPALSNK